MKMIEKNATIKSLKNGLTIFEAIIVALIILAILWFFLSRPSPYNISNTRQIICLSNMKQLGIVLTMYSLDNSNSYPTPEKWCDLIKQYPGGADDEFFQCPAAQEGKCHYAMNPDCEPNSPPDTVLLFETKGGWNLSGGPELLSTDNHDEAVSNILFNDGHVEIIKKEEIPNLNWE